jgi:serine/threonine-protein kinase
VVCVILVGKIRRLVQASRQKDLLGKYVLGERLGAGVMAEVFRAVDSPEGGFERVAVKHILPAWAGNAELVALFRREAEIGARLAHPNVAQVLDFGADGDTFFLAMEFVDGIPLSRLLRHCATKQVLLPLPALVWLAHELAVALEYVHSRTSVQGAPRAPRPEPAEHPFVGGRRGEGRRLPHRALRGPRRLHARRGAHPTRDDARQAGLRLAGAGDGWPRRRSYLFALGVTLYEAATAARLFGARSDTEFLRVLLEGPAEDPRNVRPELPAPFAELLARGVELRPASGAHVVDALAPLVRAHGTEGREQLVPLVKEAMREPATTAAPPAPARVDAEAQTITRTL